MHSLEGCHSGLLFCKIGFPINSFPLSNTDNTVLITLEQLMVIFESLCGNPCKILRSPFSVI